jgi:hypothetical protein
MDGWARAGTPRVADLADLAGRKERAPAWDLLAVLAGKAAASFAVLHAGFYALSDDDFSRVVIAERFARTPSLDPSGTSWLPLPFWLTGSAMAAFGRTLSVARVTAVVLGLLSAVLIHRAARFLGASRPAAVLGALVATACLPTAARLGVSFQPEALTSGLVVLGAAASALAGSRRLVGALCLTAACLCRYDAWPVAAGFTAFCVADAWRGARLGSTSLASDPEARTLLVAAVTACAAPLAWILHGISAHGDALFFIHRVAAYRHALGIRETFAESLIAYPRVLVSGEPELTLGAILLLLSTWRRGRGRADPETSRPFHALVRPAVLLGMLLLFLMTGRLLDGAPTHHAERTLLPIWTLLALAAIERAFSLAKDATVVGTLALPTLAVVGGVAIRLAHPPETFGARASERAIGGAARAVVPESDRLLVDTADYGYFAVISAFGAPERADPLVTHDPRDPSVGEAPAVALTRRIAETGAAYLVAPRAHWELALARGRLVATRGEFALVRLDAR